MGTSYSGFTGASMAEEIGACAMAVVNKQCSDHAVFVHLYIRTSILHTSTILLY